MMKALETLSTQKTYLNMIKAIYRKCTQNLNGEKNQSTLTKIKKTRMPSFSFLEVLARAERQVKEIKGMQIGKVQEVNIYTFADDMILYERKKTKTA